MEDDTDTSGPALQKGFTHPARLFAPHTRCPNELLSVFLSFARMLERLLPPKKHDTQAGPIPRKVCLLYQVMEERSGRSRWAAGEPAEWRHHDADAAN